MGVFCKLVPAFDREQYLVTVEILQEILSLHLARILTISLLSPKRSIIFVTTKFI
jgi:hypothetical protein